MERESFIGRMADVVRRSGVADAETLVSRLEAMARHEAQAEIDAAVREAQVFQHYCSEGAHDARRV